MEINREISEETWENQESPPCCRKCGKDIEAIDRRVEDARGEEFQWCKSCGFKEELH